MFILNQRVNTPLGPGTYQGRFRKLVDAVELCLVRLQVNEITGKHLKDERCITPKAQKTALFAFPASELGQGLVELLAILALILLVLYLLGRAFGWPW